MKIETSVRITNEGVWINNQAVEIPRSEESHWLHDIYKSLAISYPKFFKMDHLCKLGFVCAEMAMKPTLLDPTEEKRDWSVILFNHCSSLDDDRIYQKTIQEADNYYPSPAVFVYTLSNIVTGEIAIRHKIMGESCSFIEKQFSAESLYNTALLSLLPSKGIQHLLIGWIDYVDEQADALLLHVSSTESTEGGMDKKGTIALLEKLYRK